MASTRSQVEGPVLRTLSDFKAKMTGGGARPNLFEVVLQFPISAPTDTDTLQKTRFLVKAAALPASNIGPIEVPFRGRVLKLAGDRTFDTWTITVLNDTDFSIRSAFEKWMNSMNRMEDATGTQDPAFYQSDAYVYQLDRDGSTLRTYRFHDVFPNNLSSMDLNYETTDSIHEFTVEMQVQWWEAIRGTGRNAGGEDIF
ncbi:tail tube monomer protein [Synechococcus phage ACG-2014f]|uniref:Tail tube monomer protein n=5 Tax=Atlauavirus TaxID=2733092 RepID=A0A0E3I5B5_9CAUD|nr:tail tube [Synechococcus phage ACG-2014f]YP_009778283.1 tail tube [Synechococcus phage ACG-2014f_Syn7803C7]YP_009778573.1 tail tube [Synechococcus phage ACG-2014f_Syn7803C8]YP_009778852.1 tail tube [Synechococcus phage ACG-2014f_Syn7803US26]AIX16654.1 tail tube monomer protein [Synechococcus phage ACG-2014f]AIX18431.1 tail tube monomer protein [Synechococcus phage ACG-2014f]AIX20020.1 tail tube monomer protein [Synechococcus phage ACG-2014f_Syn7803C7]AIX20310.1 tail tube monomer protein [